MVAHLACENTVGVALSGSHGRDQGGRFSDVDLWHYVKQEPPAGNPELYLFEGYLVSIKTPLIEKDYATLQNPKQAIWAVPGLRNATVLYDPEGAVGALFAAAHAFRWEALQLAADQYASRQLAGLAEEIYKILDGLTQADESKTAYAIWSLTQDLATALLVQRGVFVPSENVFIACAQEAAGKGSAWTRLFRLAIGLDPLPAAGPPFRTYGLAGLALYQETAAMMKGILSHEDAIIVEHALKTIVEAGF